jgi:hypothetical protein
MLKKIETLSPTALKKFSFQSEQKQLLNREKIQNSKKTSKASQVNTEGL